MKLSVALGVAVALGGLAASAGAAAPAAGGTGAAREISTALIHAGVAEKVDTLDGVHLHLHHVVNCLVGSKSPRFSAKAEAVSSYHCEGLGNGALADAGHDPAAHRELELALGDAERGIASSQLADAHADAGKAIASLKRAQERVAH